MHYPKEKQFLLKYKNNSPVYDALGLGSRLKNQSISLISSPQVSKSFKPEFLRAMV